MIRVPRHRLRALVLIGLLVLAASALFAWRRLAGARVLDAPPPRVTADLPDSALALPESVIETLVTYDLGTALDSLEAAVPQRFGDIERRMPVAGHEATSYGFTARRTPFRASVDGASLALSADVEYQGRIWYRPPIGPVLSAGCGVGDDPRPRLRATIRSDAELTPEWGLRTRTRVLTLERYSEQPRDRCRLSVLRIDVTDRVVGRTRSWLERRVSRFDRRVELWPVRPKFERLWARLQRPIRLTRGMYLQIHPDAARLGEVSATGDTVMARLWITASPRVVTGDSPVDERPLPPLQRTSVVGNGAHVVIDGACSYEVATRLLSSQLVDRTIVQQGHHVRIATVRLSGIGGGRVALAVTLAGDVRGRLYFTGTPSLDRVRHEVHVPDLDYDVGSAQLLVQGYAWMRGVDMRDFLRDRARLPDSVVMGTLRGLAERGINRRLTEGVVLSGRIHQARSTFVRASIREIRVRAVADAEFRLAIDRGPRLPRLRDQPGQKQGESASQVHANPRTPP